MFVLKLPYFFNRNYGEGKSAAISKHRFSYIVLALAYFLFNSKRFLPDDFGIHYLGTATFIKYVYVDVKDNNNKSWQ